MIQVGDIICSGYDSQGNPENEFLVTVCDPIKGVPLANNMIQPIPWGYEKVIKVPTNP